MTYNRQNPGRVGRVETPEIRALTVDMEERQKGANVRPWRKRVELCGGRAVCYLGDCLEILPTLEAGSVDAVVTDPPYFLPASHYCTRSLSARSLSDLSMLEYFYRAVFAAIHHVLLPSGFAYVFCDGQSYPVFFLQAYPHFRRVRPIVWDKQTSINGYAWRHQHELILFCEGVDSPPVKTGDGDVLQCRAVPVAKRLHAAQKPVSLLRRLIAKTTPEGGTVLDPFMGSGSTAEAAMSLGYNFVGIESDPNYFDIACQRIADAAPLFTRQKGS